MAEHAKKVHSGAVEVDRLTPQQTIARLTREVRQLREENAKLAGEILHNSLALRVNSGDGAIFALPGGEEVLIFRDPDGLQEENWRYSFAPMRSSISD